MAIKITNLEYYLDQTQNYPCVMKFTAKWCGPCRKLHPFFEKLAAEHSNKIGFYEIDLDEAKEISKYESVRGIPLVLFFHKGTMLKDLTLSGCNPDILYNNVITLSIKHLIQKFIYQNTILLFDEKLSVFIRKPL